MLRWEHLETRASLWHGESSSGLLPAVSSVLAQLHPSQGMSWLDPYGLQSSQQLRCRQSLTPSQQLQPFSIPAPIRKDRIRASRVPPSAVPSLSPGPFPSLCSCQALIYILPLGLNTAAMQSPSALSGGEHPFSEGRCLLWEAEGLPIPSLSHSCPVTSSPTPTFAFRRHFPLGSQPRVPGLGWKHHPDGFIFSLLLWGEELQQPPQEGKGEGGVTEFNFQEII